LEVTDKRGARAEAETAADAPVENAGDAATDAEASSDGESAPLPKMDVYALLSTTISLLANGAWGWMGLTPNPFTGEMEKDMSQAKVAIDSVAFLVDRVEPGVSETALRDLRTMLSNLRVNYVQQAQMPPTKEVTS
jgi:hypothetical protein